MGKCARSAVLDLLTIRRIAADEGRRRFIFPPHSHGEASLCVRSTPFFSPPHDAFYLDEAAKRKKETKTGIHSHEAFRAAAKI